MSLYCKPNKTRRLELTKTDYYDELVERCKQGDATSYRQLYNKYAKAMYNTSLRIVNNTAEAEDVIQEAFIDAFKHIGGFEGRSSFGAWLKRIVVNKSINSIKRKKINVLDIDNVHTNLSDDEPINEAEFEFKVDEVKKAINDLPAGYRTVLSLYLLEDYSHEEVATTLNISHSTARTQYMRAKQKLLQQLKQRVML
ncbi:MAG: RNA polymerase sigma factor [Sphingobacteriales bacterium]|nr:RNA polymerase sigma factor [Sphingobacteriales bacterium]